MPHRILFDMLSIDEYSLDQLISYLKTADDLYFNDEDSFMTDDEYDAVKRIVQQQDPTNEYFGQIGSMVRGGKVDLPHQMGSLNQVYTGEVAKWVQRYQLQKDQFVISDKLDGTSALIVYGRNGKLQSGYSRGDGFQGADITRHLVRMNVPQSIIPGEVVMIRAENIISPANFKKINTGEFSRNGRIYKNPRNMVAGQMNASEVHHEILNVIDTVAYEVVGSTMSKQKQFEFLKEMGFKTAVYDVYSSASMNDLHLADILNERRKTTHYEIDGIVIDVDSLETRQRIGNTDLNPTYAVKFKIADVNNAAVTEVVDVEWNISKSGYFKPTIVFKPISLVGVTITRCTGFNAKFIHDNQIGPGAKIRITRAGDVIPFCQEVVSGMPAANWS